MAGKIAGAIAPHTTTREFAMNLLAAIALTSFVAAPVPKEPPKPESLDGEWKVVQILHGGKPRDVEMPTETSKGITINFYKESSAKVAAVVNPTGRTSIIPTGETKHPVIPVTFRKANGST